MKEDDEMVTTMTALKPRAAAPEPTEMSTVPTETLARLDRLAGAGLCASGLAHEIANPLGCLLGALEGLEGRLREIRRRGAMESGDMDALTSELELTSAATSALTDLVHDFQLYLRADATPRATPLVDVRAAVERALRMARPRLQIVARVDLQLRDVPRVRAIGNRIVQVVLNLLLNATEALSSRPQSQNLVCIRLDSAGDRTLIEISDNGPGLPGAVLERVLGQVPPGEAGRAGAGLGLAVSRELVRKMGGEISISSLPGAGTTFIVSLPSA